MKFLEQLTEGRLIRRYKRFLADVELLDGEVITAHCPNTGSMKGCQPEGARVWLSRSDNSKRKYPHTWELVELPTGGLIGINTSLSNRLVREAIESGIVDELKGYSSIRSEVRYGAENSRIDLFLQDHPSLPDCYVEVKNVTLVQDGQGMFPDAVTARGTKHLRELMEMVQQGYRSLLFFCVQHDDIDSVTSADGIDPVYGETLRQAVEQGVAVVAYKAKMSPEEITLIEALPVRLG